MTRALRLTRARGSWCKRSRARRPCRRDRRRRRERGARASALLPMAGCRRPSRGSHRHRRDALHRRLRKRWPPTAATRSCSSSDVTGIDEGLADQRPCAGLAKAFSSRRCCPRGKSAAAVAGVGDGGLRLRPRLRRRTRRNVRVAIVPYSAAVNIRRPPQRLAVAVARGLDAICAQPLRLLGSRGREEGLPTART